MGPTTTRRCRERSCGSAGQVVPGIEVDVARWRDLGAGRAGVGRVSRPRIGALDADGWFPTRDRGWVDGDGYLFIEGRADDTIIRGGENIAPAEIEDVLLAHPSVHDAAVVGLPDEEWGQRIAAAVVLRADAVCTDEELRAWARTKLRTSKTPDVIVFRPDLPHTETGKLLRRQVLADLEATL